MSRTKKAAPAETVEAYKCFGPGLVCRDFQFEVGGTYEHKGKVAICDSGFHACEMPLDCWTYYPAGSPMAKVSLSGSLQRQGGDSKVCGATITVAATVDLPDFIKAAAAWVVNAAKGKSLATGISGHAAATGDRGHAAATGYSGHAAATGYSGHAAATGISGHAAATGISGHAAATGDRGHAAVKGKNAIAASLGMAGTATAEAGGAIVLARYDRKWDLAAVFSSLVGENGIEAGKTYRLGENGPEEAK